MLTLITFLPVLGALIVALLPREQERNMRYLALGVSMLTFIASVFMLLGFDKSLAGFQNVTEAEWLTLGNFVVKFKLGIDGVNTTSAVSKIALIRFAIDTSLRRAETRNRFGIARPTARSRRVFRSKFSGRVIVATSFCRPFKYRTETLSITFDPYSTSASNTS